MPHANRDWWTEERIARLKELHAKGFSMQAMAEELGTTRNAIAGKLHRLGVRVRRTPLTEEEIEARTALRREQDAERKRRKRAKKAERRNVLRLVRANSNSTVLRMLDTITSEVGKLREVNILPHNVALTDLTDHDCRYPYGEGEFLFCGHTKQDGSSYCPAHTALCFKPVESRGVAA